MSDLRNYIGSENPYHLAAPPEWWLQVLHDYDAELVVFPSRHRMAYVLARRRHFSNAMAEANLLDKQMLRQSAGLDGDILADNNLIYVRHLIGDTVRRHGIFQWLRDNDIKANGGGEKVASRLESIEADILAQKRAHTIDNIDHRARDAWRSYQARTGRRSGYGKTRQSAKQMPVKGFTSAESPLAMFSGRDL